MTIYTLAAVLFNVIFLSLNIFFSFVSKKRLQYTQMLSDSMSLYDSLEEKNKQLKKENEDIKKENEDIKKENDFKKRDKKIKKELILQFSAKKETKMKDVIDFFISSIEKNNSKSFAYEITHKAVSSDGSVYDRTIISKADLESLRMASRISTGIVDDYSGYHERSGRGWELQNVSFSLYCYITLDE